MKYDELDDKAKERARNWYAESQFEHGWWGHVYEDAVECGSRIGIQIDTRGLGKEIDISFSGFYTQGDGCCFKGAVHFEQLENAVAKLSEHVGEDDDLFALAHLSESIHARWSANRMRLTLLADDRLQMVTTEVTIKGEERYWSTQIDEDFLDESEKDLIDDLNTLVKGFASWIYKQLENEHDYQSSDEAVEEGIKANDYEFDEEGRI